MEFRAMIAMFSISHDFRGHRFYQIYIINRETEHEFNVPQQTLGFFDQLQTSLKWIRIADFPRRWKADNFRKNNAEKIEDMFFNEKRTLLLWREILGNIIRF